MQNPPLIQVGYRVQILYPAYVTGKYGVVCGREPNSNIPANQRWLIQVENADSSDIVVSLMLDEFILINLE